MLGVSSSNGSLYMYDMEKEYLLYSKCENENKSIITQFDFTEDCSYIQCYNKNNELFYFETENSTLIEDPRLMKDMEWCTFTVPGSYYTQGIWPEYDNHIKYNSVDRSHLGKHFITCDNFGQIKLYNFPVLERSSAYQLYTGHTGEVKDIKFLYDDEYVISIGREDRCIFQWKTNVYNLYYSLMYQLILPKYYLLIRIMLYKYHQQLK